MISASRIRSVCTYTRTRSSCGLCCHQQTTSFASGSYRTSKLASNSPLSPSCSRQQSIYVAIKALRTTTWGLGPVQPRPAGPRYAQPSPNPTHPNQGWVASRRKQEEGWVASALHSAALWAPQPTDRQARPFHMPSVCPERVCLVCACAFGSQTP